MSQRDYLAQRAAACLTLASEEAATGGAGAQPVGAVVTPQASNRTLARTTTASSAAVASPHAASVQQRTVVRTTTTVTTVSTPQAQARYSAPQQTHTTQYSVQQYASPAAAGTQTQYKSTTVTTPSHQASANAYAAAARAAAEAAAAAAAEAAAQDEVEEFNPYLFIKMLPPYSTVAPAAPDIRLPRKNPRHDALVNLVLDLDETLVHCSVDPIPDADVHFPVEFNGVDYEVFVRKRPHLDRFLQWTQGKFEVTVFTASQQVYAEKLLNLLDPERKYIHHRLFRDSCLNVEGNYLKDLNVLGRDLSRTVLVDNSPHAFGYQVDNGIPIESWFDDRADTELLKLMRFLDTLTGAPDVRPVVRDKFKLHRLIEEAYIRQ